MLIRNLFARIAYNADTGAGAVGGDGAAGNSGANSMLVGNGTAGGGGATPAGGAGGAPPPVAAFAESLPEDIRGEAAFKDIKDLGSLAKSYLSAQRMLGVPPDQIVRLPGAEADAAAWDGVYAKLGRPEKADGYKFADVTLPEGLKIDDGLKGGFQEAAHKAGLSTKQADALYAWWNGEAANRYTAERTQSAAAIQAAETGLRTEWGEAFDQNLAMARQAVDHYGGNELKAELDAKGLANNPRLAKVFAALGKNLQEDGIIGRGGVNGDQHSPGEAQQQISALRADAEFTKAYTQKSHPNHADAVARMQRLYQQAYPQPAA